MIIVETFHASQKKIKFYILVEFFVVICECFERLNSNSKTHKADTSDDLIVTENNNNFSASIEILNLSIIHKKMAAKRKASAMLHKVFLVFYRVK